MLNTKENLANPFGFTQSDELRLPVIKLICIILSSYAIRSLLDMEGVAKDFRVDGKDLQALHTVIPHSENGFYERKQICQSLIVCTAVDDDDWSELTVPTIISPEHNEDILESANLQFRKIEDYKWPAPYRDTSRQGKSGAVSEQIYPTHAFVPSARVFG